MTTFAKELEQTLETITQEGPKSGLTPQEWLMQEGADGFAVFEQSRFFGEQFEEVLGREIGFDEMKNMQAMFVAGFAAGFRMGKTRKDV